MCTREGQLSVARCDALVRKPWLTAKIHDGMEESAAVNAIVSVPCQWILEAWGLRICNFSYEVLESLRLLALRSRCYARMNLWWTPTYVTDGLLGWHRHNGLVRPTERHDKASLTGMSCLGRRPRPWVGTTWPASSTMSCRPDQNWVVLRDLDHVVPGSSFSYVQLHLDEASELLVSTR